MLNMTKRASILVTLLLCLFSIFVGYYIGHQRALGVGPLNMVITNALSHQRAITMVEKKDFNQAYQYLNSILDVEIMQLYAFQTNTPDDELKRASLKTLAMIAKYRQEYPFTSPISEVDQRVKEILKQSK
jgi:hypothetical protein